MEKDNPQTASPGKCLKCRSELKTELMPMINRGGAYIGDIRMRYCGNSKCEQYNIFVKE